MITTPAFWYKPKKLSQLLGIWALAPFSWVYAWLVKKRFDLYFPVPLSKPVICVGNLVAGGAGKTPVVLSLVDLLMERGYNPHLLTRGYGGKEVGPIQVSPNRDTPEDVGDEALLLVNKAPTWVSSNRPLGAQAAIDTGANIIVMDDGFQNPVIYKDFAFLVIDGTVGLGNGYVLPAGPLRESFKSGIERADAVVIIGDDKNNIRALIDQQKEVPVLYAQLKPDATNVNIRARKIYAFAGIGRPDKFKETLEAEGAIIAGWKAFPDHFPYKEEDLQEFIAAAEKEGAITLTTAKDYVRLPFTLQHKIQKYSVTLTWRDVDAVVPLIENSLQKRMQ